MNERIWYRIEDLIKVAHFIQGASRSSVVLYFTLTIEHAEIWPISNCSVLYFRDFTCIRLKKYDRFNLTSCEFVVYYSYLTCHPLFEMKLLCVDSFRFIVLSVWWETLVQSYCQSFLLGFSSLCVVGGIFIILDNLFFVCAVISVILCVIGVTRDSYFGVRLAKSEQHTWHVKCNLPIQI